MAWYHLYYRQVLLVSCLVVLLAAFLPGCIANTGPAASTGISGKPYTPPSELPTKTTPPPPTTNPSATTLPPGLRLSR